LGQIPEQKMLDHSTHFCFILSTGTKIRIDSVMRHRSSSRGRNTSASVTVTVTLRKELQVDRACLHEGVAGPDRNRSRHKFRWESGIRAEEEKKKD